MFAVGLGVGGAAGGHLAGAARQARWLHTNKMSWQLSDDTHELPQFLESCTKLWNIKYMVLFHFHFQSSWDMCLVANTHPQPYREENLGRIKRAKQPHPQTVPSIFPNSVQGMKSSHYLD